MTVPGWRAVGEGTECRVVIMSTDAHRRRALVEALRARSFSADAVSCWDGQVGGDVRLFFVDLESANPDYMDQIHRISRGNPTLPIVVIGARDDEMRLIAAIHAGARGCIYSEDSTGHIARAAEEALRGGYPMSRGMAPLLLQYVRRTGRRKSSAEHRVFRRLTEKECEVLRQMATGQSYEDVGRAVGVSLNTVRTYVRSIYEKLDVNSRTEAVLLATELGIFGKRSTREQAAAPSPMTKSVRSVVERIIKPRRNPT